MRDEHTTNNKIRINENKTHEYRVRGEEENVQREKYGKGLRSARRLLRIAANMYDWQIDARSLNSRCFDSEWEKKKIRILKCKTVQTGYWLSYWNENDDCDDSDNTTRIMNEREMDGLLVPCNAASGHTFIHFYMLRKWNWRKTHNYNHDRETVWCYIQRIDTIGRCRRRRHRRRRFFISRDLNVLEF